MKTNLINQLRRHEGLRLKPYQCSGDPPKWTIGFGRNIEDNGITQEEAEIMLLNDLKMVEEELNGHVWYDGLSETRKAVLQNMSFNIGFLKFQLLCPPDQSLLLSYPDSLPMLKGMSTQSLILSSLTS